MTKKETHLLPLSSILRHDSFQVRDGLDAGLVRRYALALKSEAELPPVWVARIVPAKATRGRPAVEPLGIPEGTLVLLC
jgi:hypothetical protein